MLHADADLHGQTHFLVVERGRSGIAPLDTLTSGRPRRIPGPYGACRLFGGALLPTAGKAAKPRRIKALVSRVAVALESVLHVVQPVPGRRLRQADEADPDEDGLVLAHRGLRRG